MPLRDHFHSPIADTWPWSSIHQGWSFLLAQQLNQNVLPAKYLAFPHLHIGQSQVDVATLETNQDQEERIETNDGNGSVATATWAPPSPPLVSEIDFTDTDVTEVRVFTRQGHRLVAAIEILSPANKDRDAHRQAFIAKCASFLQEGVSLILIDVVNERLFNMHEALANFYQLHTEFAQGIDADMYAVAYRVIADTTTNRLEVWPEVLNVGENLPTLPLWISDELAVPVDFESAYESACRSLNLH